MLAFFAVVAGIGNGVFHPVDYTLLNRKVHTSRLGHAFSVHGITGSLGWALAPAMLVPIALAFELARRAGVGRRAGAGRAGRALAEPVAADDRDDERRPRAGDARPRHAGGEGSFGFLRIPRSGCASPSSSSTPIVISGIQAFAPEAARQLHDVPARLGGDVPDLLHGRAAPAAWCSAASSPPTRRAARRSSPSASASPPRSR